MKRKIEYINKLWGYLRKLCKPKGEGMLLMSKMLLLTLILNSFMVSLYAQAPRKDSGVSGQIYELTGRVVSAIDGKPMQDVSIRIEGENLQIRTSENGSFKLQLKNRKGKIKFSYIGFRSQELNYSAGVSLTIKLIPEENVLEEVEVVSTGYQKIPKERATGSFEFVDNKLFNRKVSTDFVSRLEDVVPGLTSTKVGNNRGAVLNVNIRGMSSINSNWWPLVVVDGVPYETRNGEIGSGLFNNLNPNDIENVTILKDAAAASIWGAQSGNGVIVVTTKKGKFNSTTQVSFNSNISIKSKPDLYYYPQIKTSDYVDLQQLLYDNGHFEGQFDTWYYNPQPVVWLMENRRTGKLSESEFNVAINKFKSIDMRDDFSKYIYRNAVNQQYNLQIQSGSEKMNTLFSAGFDKNLNDVVTSSSNRLNLKSVTQMKPLRNLLIDIGINYTRSKKVDALFPVQYNQLANGYSNYPYMKLADEKGNPLKVSFNPYNPVFLDTVANGRLLDWTYNPLKELYDAKQTQNLHDLFTNFNASYSLGLGLKVNMLYAYQWTSNPSEEWKGIGTYLQRDAINSMASYNDNSITWNLPIGDYLGIVNWESYNHQGRGSVEFNRKWNGKHELSLFSGAEIRKSQRRVTTAQYHGYEPETGSFKQVPYGVELPLLNGAFGTMTVTDNSQYQLFKNNFVSYFANANYTYLDRYLLSASFRKDTSNLFGVKSNDRGQPFWSIGGAWILSNESYWKNSVFSFLKLRSTYGYNGNVNNSVSAYPIMSISSSAHFVNNQNYAMIMSPPNPKLRWERVGIMNFGLDFAMRGNWLSGSVEYFEKSGKDLIAPDQIDPSTGFSTVMVNSAHTRTKGWDISLNARPIVSKYFSWTSNLVFTYNRTKVLKSYILNDLGRNYMSENQAQRKTPIEGMDLYSLLTYKWAGLDPETGQARAYLNGEISNDYTAIMNTKVKDMENFGSMVPLYSGSFRNSVNYKTVELSWNISYQLGHKFLRNSFDNGLFLRNGIGHKDYEKRWQKAGDELMTDVPAFVYPANLGSQIYMGSSALVEDGGQIKLRDIQLMVNLPFASNFKLRNCRVYGYVQNIGTIWRANKRGIDSEYGVSIPDPMMFSLGLSFNL